jgi:NAD(P)-dependent dehydrogenase (short-subunit alcohol dehydrogenase family)
MQQTVLITGATDGLGLGVAEALAAQGLHLILHGRNPEKLESVASRLRSESPAATIDTEVSDFQSLGDVDQMASRVLSAYPSLQVLINNAGIGSGFANRQRAVTIDGIEARFAINYLAGYHLTRRLLPLLLRSTPARIVNVASLGQVPLDFDNLQLDRDFDGGRAYDQSKLAQVMNTFDLAEELVDAGVTVNALHPASLMPTALAIEGWGQVIDRLEDGVAATVRLAVDNSLAGVSGRFFNRFDDELANDQAYQSGARAQLRSATEQLIQRVLAE